jgi:ATP/maltotriose-dependent transcriptional regulator MalT
MMQMIQLYGSILAGEELDPTDVETIMVYQDNQQEFHDPLIFELSFYVFIKGYQNNTTIDYYIEGLKHYRYIGDVVQLSQSILFLAEYYIQQQDITSCKTVLEEFITLYQTYNIHAPLDSYTYHFYDILIQLDPDIPVPVPKQQILTEKEMEVLRYLQQGLTNKEIAQKLYISPGTVKWHTTNIYSKLDVNSRLAAVQKAIELDYL